MKEQNIAPIQCDDMDMILQRFDAWWENKSIVRPMMHIVAKRDTPLLGVVEEEPFVSYEDSTMNLDRKIVRMRNELKINKYYAEAYPNMRFYMGAGSLAAYMGSIPGFNKETIWFHPGYDEVTNLAGAFNTENKWFKKQVEDMKISRDIGIQEGFLLSLPDLIENMDIYSSLRGAQETCFDIMDDPEIVKEAIHEIDEAYFKVYDAFMDATKRPDGISAYVFLQACKNKKVSKVQCDFSAMLSQEQFGYFIVPSLERQTSFLDHAVYHLDGKDAVRHLDALLDIKGISAMQWEPGAGKAPSGSEEYYPIYDRMRAGGKALEVFLNFGGMSDWINTVDRMVDRYGNQGLYFIFNNMTEREAEYIMEYSDKHWSSRI
ncbi:MAG: hypothetical protein R3Y47_09040 [Lachnospiraceae bacterium]